MKATKMNYDSIPYGIKTTQPALHNSAKKVGARIISMNIAKITDVRTCISECDRYEENEGDLKLICEDLSTRCIFLRLNNGKLLDFGKIVVSELIKMEKAVGSI